MSVQIFNFRYAMVPVLLLFLFSLLGLSAYQGSSFYYFTFDLMWLAVLFSALTCSQTYVICYIQIMLFLGFWMKFMACLILGVAFVEPTGYWTAGFAHSAAWDQVLLRSSLAAAGILLANLFFFLATKNKPRHQNEATIPQWYSKHSNLLWSLLVLVGIIINSINFAYRISVTGLRPQLILPFHLNALMIWAMVIAIPLCMAAFLGWERDPEQQKKRFYLICFMAFITSLSVLSRAVYIFWTVPYLFLVISNPEFSWRRLSLWDNRKIALIYIGFAVLSLVKVSIIRTDYYTVDRVIPAVASEGQPVNQVKKLFVGRWVGLEAVMATTAFPEAGWSFFSNSLLEKPAVGEVGAYTREVLVLNKYNASATTMFSSLPGLVGILNYANSGLVVLGGMFVLCFFLCAIEWLGFLLLKNKFLLAQQAVILSYWCVSGLNIPYLGLINLLECCAVVFLLKLINPCYQRVMSYWQKKPVHALVEEA